MLTKLTSNLTATVGSTTFQRVIAVNPDLSLATAKSMTAKNGYDEVFIRTDKGKLYAAIGPGGRLNVREGYKATVNGQTGRVVAVDDEANSAGEGALSPLRTMQHLAVSTGATAMTAMVTTTVGGMMAGAAMGTPQIMRIGELAKTTGSAFSGAFQKLTVTGAVGLGITAAVIGTWSVIGAIRGGTRKGDEQTLQQLQ